MSVMGHRMLDLFKLFPANVALVRVANQCPPLLSWFTPTPVTWLSLIVLHGVFCSAVSIRARVRWIGQHAVDRSISRSSPDHLVASCKLQCATSRPLFTRLACTHTTRPCYGCQE